MTLLLQKKEEIKEKRNRKERRRNVHCDIMKSILFLLYTTYICLLYYCTTVYVCSDLYLLLQSIFAHEKNTILYASCAHI